MTIGERIKARREELGLSQLELSKRMGYTNKTTISKVENGGDNITTDRISRFANALFVSESYLMGWESDEKKYNEKNADILMDILESPDLIEICNTIKSFSPGQIELLKQYVSVLSQHSVNDSNKK